MQESSEQHSFIQGLTDNLFKVIQFSFKGFGLHQMKFLWSYNIFCLIFDSQSFGSIFLDIVSCRLKTNSSPATDLWVSLEGYVWKPDDTL